MMKAFVLGAAALLITSCVFPPSNPENELDKENGVKKTEFTTF